MKINLGIINFGVGNLKSIIQVFSKLSIRFNIKIIQKPSDFKNLDRLIIPGQGSMFNCVDYLNKLNLSELIKNFSRPILGICLGKHLFFNKSDEGNCLGLNKFKGYIKKFYLEDLKFYKIPHLGWNRVKFINQHKLFSGIPNLSFFYFAHSFYVLNKDFENIYGLTKYNFNFSSIFIKNNIILTQFHPEKSSFFGLKLCYNFSIWNI